MKNSVKLLTCIFILTTASFEQSSDQAAQLAPSITEFGIFKTVESIPKPEALCIALTIADMYQSKTLPSLSFAQALTKNIVLGYSYGVGEKLEHYFKDIASLTTTLQQPMITGLTTLVCGILIYLLQTNEIEESFAEETLKSMLTALATRNIQQLLSIATKTLNTIQISQQNKQLMIVCSAGIMGTAVGCALAAKENWLPLVYQLGQATLETLRLPFIAQKATNAYCWLAGYRLQKYKDEEMIDNIMKKESEDNT